MKAGIYQTIKPHTAFEKHGGGTIKHEIYWNLCFYDNSRMVGFFGSDKDYLKPYAKKAFDIKGEVINEKKGHLELFLFNPFANVKKFYKGKIDHDRLYLEYYFEDKPNDIFKDVFEYIGDGHTPPSGIHEF